MALTNSGLGMAHGVAAALGTHCRVPHGAACALMLPAAIRANMEVCQSDFGLLCGYLFRRRPHPKTAADAASAFLEEIERLCDRVGVPRRLSQVGVTPAQIPALVKSSRGASMSGNPRELSDAELTEILEGIL
jgi:alcohol dehydrogenase class IV